MTERELRERMVVLARSLFDRGYGCGTSGNISVKVPDGVLITPTNSCLGRFLTPEQVADLRAHFPV